MTLDKHDKVRYLHEMFCMLRTENEDDGSAPIVLGIDIGYPERGLSRRH